MFTIGMIHGRFQPFHMGHFLYLKDALIHSQKLIVGITNPDPSLTNFTESDSHRHELDANPFPYYLRMKMIQKSISMDTEIRERINDITIVPFPINKPETWQYYIPPKNIIQIMNLIDPWDRVKKEMFEKNGYQVYVLGDNRHQIDNKPISGTIIRKNIKENEPWGGKVPPGTKYVLENWLKGKVDL